MAKFLLNVTYPPAQRRAFDNELSERAQEGFELFHITGDVGGTPGGNLCGNCHRMPFWVSTNTPGTGMDARMRGAYDRFLILPQGRLNIIDFPFIEEWPNKGFPSEVFGSSHGVDDGPSIPSGRWYWKEHRSFRFLCPPSNSQ